MNPEAGSLEQLHDIVMPAELPWWPPAPGWFLLALLLIATSVTLVHRRMQTWRKNAYRREAEDHLTQAKNAREVAEILRRTALAFAERKDVASLGGEEWVDWLSSRSPNPVPESVAHQLKEAPYRDQSTTATDSIETLKVFATEWIRNHQVNPVS